MLELLAEPWKTGKGCCTATTESKMIAINEQMMQTINAAFSFIT
jgi:hypothetical protein